jgi:hypothetical protein
MSGVAIIRALLAANSAVLAAVPSSKIMAGVIPLGTVLPAISIAQISGTTRNTISMTAAKTQGERLFSELLGEHRSRLTEERERAKYAYDARYQAIGRIGLPAVREHRRKRLDAEHQARMAALDDAEASVPDLNAVMMLRVGAV